MTIRSAIQTQTKSFVRWLRRPTDDDPREALRRFKAILRQCLDDGERDYVMAATEKDSSGPDPVADVRALALQVLEHGGQVKAAAREVLGVNHPKFDSVMNRVRHEMRKRRKSQSTKAKTRVCKSGHNLQIAAAEVPWPHEHVAPKLDATNSTDQWSKT